MSDSSLIFFHAGGQPWLQLLSWLFAPQSFWGQVPRSDIEPHLRGEGLKRSQTSLDLPSKRPAAGQEELAALSGLGFSQGADPSSCPAFPQAFHQLRVAKGSPL